MQRSAVTAARPLRRLLVATDFSSGAAAALSRLPHLALAPRAEITILHVLADMVSSALRERELAEAERRLRWETARLLRELRALGRKEVRVRTAVAQGRPHLEILRQSGSMDLLVVGRHGRRPFPDLLVGSTAERVIAGGAAGTVGIPPTDSGR
jgi:nucleotide-binding universal stress UspA family protein